MNGIVRRCNKDDIESFIELSGYAYSIPDSSFENFREKWDDIHNEIFLSEVDGIPVATARMIPLIQNIRGTMKNMGGIGLVAGSPEYRRKGYVRDLMFKMLEDIREKDYAVSCLYPFKDSFYSAMGYVKLPPTRRLEFDPVTLRGISKPEGYTVSRESGDEAFQVWRTLHEEMVKSTHGAAGRRDIRWLEYTRKFTRKIAVARNPDNKAEGVMVYSVKGYGEGHDWSEPGEISIGSMLWSSLEGRDSLLHFIYGHSDQIKKVKLMVTPHNEDYYHWLTDYHTPTISSNIIAMARIVDVEKSFNSIKVGSSGRIILEVTDSHLDWNNGTFELHDQNGALSVSRSQEEAKVMFTIEGLTAVLYGTLGESQLRRLGWLRGESPTTLYEWLPRAFPWLSESF